MKRKGWRDDSDGRMIGMNKKRWDEKKCWNAGIKVKRDDLDGWMIGMDKKRRGCWDKEMLE